MGSLLLRRPALRDLAKKYGTDKASHGYIEHYERYFGGIRGHRLNVLEIGIGGYDAPRTGGESLRMWRDYFGRSVIHGIDVEDKTWLSEKRIRIHRGDQGDASFLDGVGREIGPLDVVIDDGSHRCEHVLTSFRALFPHVKPGGTYVIEDLHASYWKQYGGSAADLDDEHFTVAALKRLVDGLHHPYIPGRTAAPFDESVAAVHFHPKIAFIVKGTNRPTLNDWFRKEIERAD